MKKIDQNDFRLPSVHLSVRPTHKLNIFKVSKRLLLEAWVASVINSNSVQVKTVGPILDMTYISFRGIKYFQGKKRPILEACFESVIYVS